MNGFKTLLALVILPSLAPAGVSAAPQIFAGGVVNAASFDPAPALLGPGSIAAVFGTDLAASVHSTASATLPASLGNTQVLVNSVAAPLFFVSPGQVNFQVPWEVGNLSQFTVVVVTNGVRSNEVTVQATGAAPGCFKVQGDLGAILISGTDVLPAPAGSVPGRNARPARPGEYLSLYCTGLGAVTNPPVTGAPGSASPLSETLAVPTVTIGTVPARVTFSGLAPGLTGCNQINVEVPGGAPSGDSVPIVVTAGGGMSNTVTAAISGTAGPAAGTLAIASLNTTSLLPMTPLAIRVVGLSGTENIQVRYSNAAGFSPVVRPIRAGPDGTLIAPVPLYVDPSAKQIAAGSVSLVISQGTRSTAPVTLAIRNLPPLSEYGTPLGKISEAVLVFDSIMIGQRLNQFQSYQTLPGSVNTSQARTMLSALLRAVHRARTDVSQVAAHPSLVIPAGTLADGTALQFDRDSLELMDRVNGLFLSQTFAAVPLPPAVRGRAAANLSAADLIRIMESTTDANAFLEASMESMNPQNTWKEMTEASATALGVYFNTLPAAKARLLGPMAAILSDMCAIGHAFGNMGALIAGLATRNGERAKVAYDALNESTADTISAGIDMVLLLTGNVAQLGAASTVAGFVKSFYDLYVTNQSTLDGITATVANDVRGRSPAGTFGVATGSTPLPVESQLTSPQAGIEICCFTASGSTLTSVSDPSGRYTVWIPLQAAGTDYQRLLVRALSLLSGVEVASGTRDMRGLKPDTPLTLSPLTTTPSMTDVYEGTYSLTVTETELCISTVREPVMAPAVISATGANITLVSSAALETVPPGGSSAFTGWLLAQGVPSLTFACEGGSVTFDPTPFGCAANGAFVGTTNGTSVALTMQTSIAGCPDHIIPGTVSVAGSKPVVNLSATYTQLTMFGHPAQVVFSATLTKK
ncbi:MAG: hypothetical protein ACE141_15460 [Bryobacteraceae bacterium]